MNGAKARRLRREAEADSVGLAMARYKVGKAPTFVPRMVPILVGGDVKMVPKGFKQDSAGKPTVLDLCTRSIYQDLKKGGSDVK